MTRYNRPLELTTSYVDTHAPSSLFSHKAFMYFLASQLCFGKITNRIRIGKTPERAHLLSAHSSLSLHFGRYILHVLAPGSDLDVDGKGSILIRSYSRNESTTYNVTHNIYVQSRAGPKGSRKCSLEIATILRKISLGTMQFRGPHTLLPPSVHTDSP
jgi:hypothetical protein